MIVRVPASSANLGPGFDALGMALTLYLEAELVVDHEEPCDAADAQHPAVRAFHAAGGAGGIWVRSSIPMGRGLGFSGAARVAGLLLAHVAEAGAAGRSFDRQQVSADVLARGTELEGHADNIAASLFGGVVATAGGAAVRVPLALDPAVVVWVPPSSTSTRESRTKLPASVAFDDAVFNVTRAALLVAALGAGDVGALRVATQDRLHQDVRFEAAPASKAALAAVLEAGAWCGWLSGSGPTIASLCDAEEAPAIVAALPQDGRASVLAVDPAGAVVLAG